MLSEHVLCHTNIVVFGYGFDTKKFTHVFDGFFTAAGTLSPNPPEQYGLHKPTNTDNVNQRHFKAYKTVCVYFIDYICKQKLTPKIPFIYKIFKYLLKCIWPLGP